MRYSIFAVLAAFAAPLSWAQQDFSQVEIQTIDVAPGIYMLVGAGGNLGLSVGEDGAFLIDDQFAPLSGKIMAAIAELTDAPVEFLVNTHWHGDHTGGNEAFGNAGAVIVAHDNVRVRMSTEQFREVFDQSIPPSPPEALPIVTFNDTFTPALERGNHPCLSHGGACTHGRRRDPAFPGRPMSFTWGTISLTVSILSSMWTATAISTASLRRVTGYSPCPTPTPGSSPATVPWRPRRILRAWLQMLRTTRESIQDLIDQACPRMRWSPRTPRRNSMRPTAAVS